LEELRFPLDGKWMVQFPSQFSTFHHDGFDKYVFSSSNLASSGFCSHWPVFHVTGSKWEKASIR